MQHTKNKTKNQSGGGKGEVDRSNACQKLCTGPHCTRRYCKFYLIGSNQRQQTHRFARSGWHFQKAVTTGIEGLLQRSHVLVLLEIYSVVGKENVQTIKIKPHDLLL